jgi:hypothetical protein
MTKLILIAATAAVAAVAAPRPVAAEDCVKGYEQCLNDTYDTSGATRILADIECFAGYVGCVRRLI